MPGSKRSEYELEHSKYLQQKSGESLSISEEKLAVRKDLVYWIVAKSNELSLSVRAVQLSVIYYDILLSKEDLENFDHYLMASASISLSNLHESQTELTSSQVNSLIGRNHTRGNLIQAQDKLLGALSYELDLCTASEVICFFAEYYGFEYRFHFERAKKLSELCYLNNDIYVAGPLVIAAVACYHTFQVLGLSHVAQAILHIAHETIGANPTHVNRGINILNDFLSQSQKSNNINLPTSLSN